LRSDGVTNCDQMKFLLDREETARMHFRIIERSDFASWLPFFQNPDSFRYWNMQRQAPEIECRQWYDKQFDRYDQDTGGMNVLIEKSSGNLIGHCGLLVQNVDGCGELEIGYSLLPAFWSMGFASEAASKCRDVAFDRGYSSSLISIISLANTPSARVAEKNGMAIDKQTVYNNNEVNIFRITVEQWKSISGANIKK
jgi:ribosomal-protein-alanine N-acetyltransferase